MQTANYLEQAKSFLARNGSRMALRAVPLALLAAGVAHASTSLTFNGPTNTSFTNSCASGGGVSGMGGAPTSGGLGLTLFGNATETNLSTGPCTITAKWSGAGSGVFPGTTATIGSTFSILAPPDVAINSCTLVVYLNGVQAAQFNPTCASARPPEVRGPAPRVQGRTIPVSLAGQTFSVPAALTSWEVDLAVTGTWNDSLGTSFTVTVPGGASIDILAQTSGVPALTPLAFGMTAILLLSLAGFGILRRKSTGSGFPGRPS